MLLAVDVGNTNTVLGLFKGKKLIKTGRIESSKTSLLHWAKKNHLPLDGVMISSVVPSLRKTLFQIFKKYRALFVGPHLKMPIRIKVKSPGTVGADRIVNAVAARQHFSGRPLLIIDFGTATTFDVVTAHGEFIGGAIAPGLQTINEALAKKCAQLPSVPLRRPKKLIGRDTKEAIRSGVFLGYASLVEGMIERFKKELGARLKVIATGGLAGLMARDCRQIDKIDLFLTLRGLRILYRSTG